MKFWVTDRPNSIGLVSPKRPIQHTNPDPKLIKWDRLDVCECDFLPSPNIALVYFFSHIIYSLFFVLSDYKMQKMGILGARSWLCRSISSSPLRVCVVGSGPAGFYTAEKVKLYSLRFKFENG